MASDSLPPRSSSFAKPKSSSLIGALLRDHDVGGLEIAVNDARRMGCRKCAGDLSGVPQRLTQRQALSRDYLVQRLAGHVLHGNEQNAVGLVDVVYVDDVGMVERGSRLSLLHKPAAAVGIVYRLRQQHLQRYRAVQMLVPGFVYGTHASLAEFARNLEMSDHFTDHCSR